METEGDEMEIDLTAIRGRDGDWKDDGTDHFGNAAARDRRALLDYIDELQSIVEEIAVDVGLIKQTYRERWQAALFPNDVEEKRAENRRTHRRNYETRKKLEKKKKADAAPR